MEQSSIESNDHQLICTIINGIERPSVDWNNHQSNRTMISRMEKSQIEWGNHQSNRTIIDISIVLNLRNCNILIEFIFIEAIKRKDSIDFKNLSKYIFHNYVKINDGN